MVEAQSINFIALFSNVDSPEIGKQTVNIARS